MATSPIYSWPEPDNTDLVKNGALAIRTMGDAIDTTMGTMVAKTIIDAKGDLIAGSAADTVLRLAVGTNGQTLVADSTASTGLKWATVAAGAMTKIASASFSGATDTSTTFDNVFSATYKNYYLVMSNLRGGSSEALKFQFRVAGPTTDATGYYGNRITDGTNSATSNGTSFSLLSNYNEGSSLNMLVAINDTPAQFSYTGLQRNSAGSVVIGACMNDGLTSDSAKGFILSGTSNISGFCAVYGLAN
jgi:hypothetical protein